MGWQTGKPKERGKYLVTMEYWVGDKERYVDIAYYGKPFGKRKECFYRVDDEWGDIILDDVLAWMPLPKPWKGERYGTDIKRRSQKKNNRRT